MKRAILVDHDRTEHDDFELNIRSCMGRYDGVVKMVMDDGLEYWVIQSIFG